MEDTGLVTEGEQRTQPGTELPSEWILRARECKPEVTKEVGVCLSTNLIKIK